MVLRWRGSAGRGRWVGVEEWSVVVEGGGQGESMSAREGMFRQLVVSR